MTPADSPRPRKALIVLTDAEWRQLRIAAAEDETTIQGWLTNVTLAALQARSRRHDQEGQGRRPTPKRSGAG